MSVQTQTYFRFADAVKESRDPQLKALAEMLDRQERERIKTAAALAGAGPQNGIYADPLAGIFGFGVQRSLGPDLSVGSLVYVQRARNVAAADSVAGFPAAGVVVARLSDGYVLWAPLALLEVFVEGDPLDVEPTATNLLWLGQSGFGAFKPPSTSGSVSQQVGTRYYANQVTHRSYCLVFPGGVRVGL